MKLGEVGCALSHVRAWPCIAEELGGGSDEYRLVLEDDASLSHAKTLVGPAKTTKGG